MNSTQRRIKLLSPELRDQIAAGEVVERPASVLKELLENSLDAGATEIIIKTENGGQSYISVRDNGFGIKSEDLALAVSSHATSKISSFNDLLHVTSYGFRGEALPSIASVAKLRLSSLAGSDADGNAAKPEDAAFIEVNFSRVEDQGQTVLPYGTLIEVRDLFANVPARLKFLKTNSTELKRCQDVVTRTALTREDVTFVLYSETRELCRFMQGEDLRARIAKLWPPQITNRLGSVGFSRPGIKVKGLVSHPGAAQQKGDRMLFYVNNRAINNRLLQQAVRQAYQGRLLAREYPQVVLFVDIEPEEVDVNVHPAKSEVRFRDERSVFGAVLHAVERALSVLTDSDLSGTLDAGTEHSAALKQSFGQIYAQEKAGATSPYAPEVQNQSGFRDTENRPLGFWGELDKKFTSGLKVNESAAAYYPLNVAGNKAAQANSGGAEASGSAVEFGGLNMQDGQAVQSGQSEPSGPFGQDSLPLPVVSSASSEASSEALPETSPKTSPTTSPDLLYLGQLGDSYLIVLKEDKLLLLDQHAVHERVLMQRFSSEASAGQTQLLALPLELQLHPAETVVLQQLWGDFLRLGFSLQSSGGAALSVKGIPPLLSRTEARDFLREALALQKNSLQELLIMMSCKGAIKAGQRLSRDEAMMLLQEWLAVPDREYCPHGRPAVLVFGMAELEKMFKRRGT